MLSSRNHIFHDKENILVHKTPARGLGGSGYASQQGFKTVGRPTTAGGKMDLGGANKLTMTTRTGKGAEKQAGSGKGGGEEGALIEPKRLFGTTKTNSSTPYVQPNLSLSTNQKPANPFSKSTMSLSASLSVPSQSNLLPSHLKTPARPSSSNNNSNSTPLPSAGRTRRRSMKLHSTPIKDVTFSTPVGLRMAPDLSFELEDAEMDLGLDGVTEEKEQEEEESGDDEVEYMPPSAIIEPFSLPYDCIDAKTLGTRIRQMPLFLPTFDEEEDGLHLPDVVIELQEGGGWTSYNVPVREIESDDEFGLNLDRRRPTAHPSRPSSKAATASSSRIPGSTLPSRRPPSSASSTVRSTSGATASSLRRPLDASTSTSKPSAPSTLRQTPSSRPPTIAAASSSIRKPISSTLPPSSRRPAPSSTTLSTSSSLRRPLAPSTTKPISTSTTRPRPALPSSFTSAAVAAKRKVAVGSKSAEDAMFPSSLDAISFGPDSFLVNDKEGMFEL